MVIINQIYIIYKYAFFVFLFIFFVSEISSMFTYNVIGKVNL